MHGDEFTRWLALIATLTTEQCRQLRERLDDRLGAEAISAVIEGRLSQRPCCPKCGSQRVVRNGRANGLQRYRCRGCTVTFNALTGTPLARLRHRQQWLAQAQALDAGLSVRKAAAQLGIHRTTAFRWRHRFLTRPCTIKATGLTGVAEADETYLLRSYKGQHRRLIAEHARAPRRRGGKAAKRGLSAEQVPILMVRDRSGKTADSMLERADQGCLRAVLQSALAEDALLCTDASAALTAAATAMGIEHHPVNTGRGERRRGPWHIQNVNAYHGRFKAWLARFHGVATSYLPNYLGWFRALDRNTQAGAQPVSLLALAVGA